MKYIKPKTIKKKVTWNISEKTLNIPNILITY